MSSSGNLRRNRIRPFPRNRSGSLLESPKRLCPQTLLMDLRNTALALAFAFHITGTFSRKSLSSTGLK